MTFFNSSVPLVLLVDNCRIDNIINKNVLEKHHFAERINVFSKPLEAMAYLQQLTEETEKMDIPSYVFLDWNMPLLNGEEFIDEFENLSSFIKKRCKIIVISFSPNIKENVLNREYMGKVVSKPLMISNLIDIKAREHCVTNSLYFL